MKTKLFLAALLFTAGTFLLNAQPPRSGAGAGQGQGQGQGQGRNMATPEERANHITAELALTEAQKAKVLELFKQDEVKVKAFREELKSLREKNEKMSDAQREKYAAQRKAHDAELEKIIGTEKMTQWQTQHKADMQKMKGQQAQAKGKNHAANKSGEHRPEMRAERAQKMKENFAPEKRAERLKAELGLSDAEKDALVKLFDAEQKKISEERKQKMEENRKLHDAEIEKIIGKEKMAKYKELQKSKIDKVKKNRAEKTV